MSSLIIDQVVKQLSNMPDELQQKVLDFSHSLMSSRSQLQGKPIENLLQFVGTISVEDLEIMRQVIEEDCGKVDVDGW